jgi:acetyltransferase
MSGDHYVMGNLRGFFSPKVIAVIGASERLDSIGSRILHNLIGSYEGKIFPVNVFRQTVQGLKAYPSIDRVPSKVDFAIIATPAHTVPQIVEECGMSGVLNAVIVSAGFGECDAIGKELSRRIFECKKNYGIRIIGPNSFGIIRPNANLYATFAEKKAVPGKIAFISQSGAFCGAALDWSLETRVGLSAVVSLGQTIDVNIGDLIEYFGTDPQTRIIMLYAESIQNARSFMSAARGFAKTKPIIIVKPSRKDENQNLGFSDNSQLKEAIYDAAFRRSGVVRVETINGLFDCAKTLDMQPSPAIPDLTIITNAAGPALMALDQINRRGGKLAEISDLTLKALRNVLPYYCGLTNPIDLLEEATPERYRKVVQTCIEDKSRSSLLVIYAPTGLTSPNSLADLIVASSKQTRKNILVCLMGEDPKCQDARRTLHLNGVPAFRTPQEAVRTFMNIYARTQNLELLYQTPEESLVDPSSPTHLRAILRSVFSEGREILNLSESFQFLDAYKIPTVKTLVARNAEESAASALKLGYPVVMKTLNSEFSPKHENHSFGFDVFSPDHLFFQFNQLFDETKAFSKTAEFQGVAIQPKLLNAPCRLFLGSRKDPQFGSIVCLGTGGALVEKDRELSVGFPPLNQVLSRQIMENTKALQYCKDVCAGNFENGPIEEILIRFSQLVVDFPEIKKIDINPIIVKDGKAFAADAQISIDLSRFLRQGAEHPENLVIAPYPKKYITKRTLKNGVKVTLRPIKPEDEKRFNALFKSLSAQSVRFRFFETIKEMSHDTLSRYCNLDYDREIAVVAQLDDSSLIGVVRLILDGERKNGEFAIMVSDSWHGLGLGSKLMDYLIDIGTDLKLETIYSDVSPENEKMLSLCGKKGFTSKSADEYSVFMSKTLMF